jgi:hypothetical protein
MEVKIFFVALESRSDISGSLLELMCDDVIRFVIVEIRAGIKLDRFFLDRLIEVFKEPLVGPCLIGRMRRLGLAAFEPSQNQRVLIGPLRLFPLLQFKQNRGVAHTAVFAGENEVNPIGGLGDVVFDCNSCVRRNPPSSNTRSIY